VVRGTLPHGIVGLFIGPIILSLAWELTVAWIRAERAETEPLPADRRTLT
jgi:predicted PurR-regulated permease PerM